MLRQLLSRQSRSSSCISGIVSLLSKFTLKEHQESQSPPGDPPVVHRLNLEVGEVIAFQKRRTKEVNSRLIKTCCSHQVDCLHRALADDHLPTDLTPYHNEINYRDDFGNNYLFFAARAAAPFEVLRNIIDVIDDVNVLNEDRQNFLFVLDPSGLRGHATEQDSHSGNIRKLLLLLYIKCFDFGHTDNEGRNFLSMMSLHRSFSLQWLAVMDDCEHLRHHLALIGGLRDYKRAFLLDYLSHRWRTKSITAGVLKTITHFLVARVSWVWAFPDASRDTLIPLEDVVDPGAFPKPRRLVSDLPGFDSIVALDHFPDQTLLRKTELLYLNGYGADGMTDLFRGLLHVLQGRSNVKLTKYDDKRINFNARCLEGRTILRLSTLYNRADVLQEILAIKSQTIRINDRDHHGFSALDYATDRFNQSRTPTGTAQDLANALKCIMYLVDHGAQMSFSPNAEEGTHVRTNNGNTVVVPATEPISLSLYS
ncbi:hypothetical protein K491DRAFT_697548 [Lophiostoma macrostomum CBS 122681]|uniref:Ankyrin n=1 Tax=Lophiostoma macrostomum CBS 122681 TaxID=1314788 RepID=A0A6A6ST40_9PLEO|nr:hypothetical protein K491DRAFT_697548 [Lophiostoma macrostomum CBS 122681]